MSAERFVFVGAGPAALACALWRARRGRLSTLLMPKGVERQTASWIEAVPMKSLAELVDLGAHPGNLGVKEFMYKRAVAWTSPEPDIVETDPAAHVERPALEHTLLNLAQRNKCIAVVSSNALALSNDKPLSSTKRGERLIDASGRRALLASRIHRFRQPWVARTFAVECDVRRAVAPLMIAALPQGYLYRVSGACSTTIGVVGRGTMLMGDGSEVCRRLLESQARWAVMDLAARGWVCTGSRPASVQWAEASGTVAIGDAAFARDALSSQGLASSLLEARYASEIENDSDCAALATRSLRALHAHCAAMHRMLDSVCYKNAYWKQYQQEFSRALAVPQNFAIGSGQN